MKKLLFIFRVDNAIDLITNSSSELFVIKADKQKEMVIELTTKALEGLYNWNVDLGERVLKEKDEWDVDWDKRQLLDNFPEDKHEIIEELFSKPNWYSFVIDRDHSNMYEIRNKLQEIGFELIDSDY